MLTPVDIQQKKFKVGIGFEKKDVSSFFEEVAKSYEELYRSNAELKERVITLTDALQHYKATEENLKKNLLLAEKNTEESKTNAAREAKTIELEARSHAAAIVRQANEDLSAITARVDELRSFYAEYRTKYALMLQAQMEYLNANDIDPEAYYDPEAAATAPNSGSSSGGKQNYSMGDSGLGSSAAANNSREQNRSSAANVYGSVLGGDERIDPFDSSSSRSSGSSQKKSGSGTPLRMKGDVEPAESFGGSSSKTSTSKYSVKESDDDLRSAAASRVKEKKSDSSKDKIPTGDGFEFL